VIEHSVLSAHRHVFGVLAWFSVLAAFGLGPAGALIYRMAELVAHHWRRAPQTQDWVSGTLQSIAGQAWHSIDWLPARLTAVGFAVVGNFEEAIDYWRNYAQQFADDNDGVIIAATAGALDLRLGGEALRQADADVVMSEAVAEPQDSESTPGREPELGHLASLVGLVWRCVVLWVLLLALLTLARLLG